MNTSVMNLSQQNLSASRFVRRFSLTPHSQSATLRTGHRPSVLMVQKGRAWVTLPGQGGDAARDLWLDAGECLKLAPNQTLWVDGWPQAELQLLPATRPARAPGLLRRLLGWALRRRQSRLAAAEVASGCCGA